jgi:DNA-directed RNA polymerase subunit RPC12/RpoP
MGKMNKLYELIKKRLKEVRTDRFALADVTFALRKLTEDGGPPGIARDKVQTLYDLQQQAEAAESTHDPKQIQALVTALNAFLDEEMAEAMRARSKAHTEDESEGDECESCGHSLEGVTAKLGKIICPGCGHQLAPAATESARSSKVTCSACNHTFRPPQEADAIVCPKCSMPVVSPEAESKDPDAEIFAPYNPVSDESEDESEDEVHAIRHHKSKRRKRETQAVRTFRRALRGDSPRLSRHLGPVDTFAALCPIPPRASASPRPVSAAAARFNRSMNGNPLADRVDRLTAQGKSPAEIFRALTAGR